MDILFGGVNFVNSVILVSLLLRSHCPCSARQECLALHLGPGCAIRQFQPLWLSPDLLSTSIKAYCEAHTPATTTALRTLASPSANSKQQAPWLVHLQRQALFHANRSPRNPDDKSASPM